MADYKEEIYEQEMYTLGKAFTGYLIGIGTILSMWFLSGLYYVILK